MGASPLDSFLDRAVSRDDAAVWHREAGVWSPGDGSPGRDIRELAAALAGFGLVPGRAAVLIADEGPDACRAALAVLATGGCLVRLGGASAAPVVFEALSASVAVLAIVETQSQLQQVLSFRPELPSLELVILLAAETSERKPAALLVSAAVEIGASRLAEDPELLRRARAGAQDSEAAMLVARGRGLRPVSRADLARASDRMADALSLAPGRTVLAALPVEGTEAIAVLLGALARGATILVAEPGERLDLGIRERRPSAAIVTKEAIEGLHRAWEEEIEARSWLAKTATRWALRHGADSKERTWRQRVAELIALSRIRARWGGSLMRWGVTTPPREETARFFAAVGSPTYLVAGQAEISVAR